MVKFTIQVIVGEDRQLHITLPDDFPIGPVEVTITPVRDEPDYADESSQLQPDGPDSSQPVYEERQQR